VDWSLASLFAALLLACVFLLPGGVDGADDGERPLWSRRRWISAASGVSVAYVFVDVLPELGAQSGTIVAAAGRSALFAEQRIYLLALAAFVVFYGLQHMVLSSRVRRRGEVVEGGTRDGVYWLHVGGFAAYGALIGYLLVERAEQGMATVAVYALAMAIHFLIVGHSLSEEHGRAYREGGRRWLAASVLAGWAIGATLSLSEVAFARMFALLAGGVVITSLNAELRDERDGRFWPFCLGAAAFAVLLLAAA
jgi:hypothetical protein